MTEKPPDIGNNCGHVEQHDAEGGDHRADGEEVRHQADEGDEREDQLL